MTSAGAHTGIDETCPRRDPAPSAHESLRRPAPAPPAEQFAVQDRVTHDKYGLGRVISVQDDAALVIDFGSRRVRITMPCAKLAKL